MECIPQAISLNSKVIPKHIVYQVATNHLQRVISFLGIKSLESSEKNNHAESKTKVPARTTAVIEAAASAVIEPT